ncbi:MAG TPA: hypothetical protein VNC50_02130, partial [Planctomycetia bacterium]|nr:hypothetical protein [Planctomycetia bacterium]
MAPRFLLLALAWAFSAVPAFPQKAERTIVDVTAGYGFSPGSETTLKLGHWAPIAVTVSSKGSDFRGEVRLATPDGEGVLTRTVIPNVFVPEGAGKTTVVRGYVKFGRNALDVDVELVEVDDDGKSLGVVDARSFKLNDAPRRAYVVNQEEPLVVYHGGLPGLFEMEKAYKAKLDQNASRGIINGTPIPARFRSESDMPKQWYAYGGANVVVFSTYDEKLFDRLDPAQASALRTWVRQGGDLVVTVAKNWQTVSKSFLAPMLPATVVGAQEVPLSRVPVNATLETFAGAGGAMALGANPNMNLVKLEGVRGKTIRSAGDQPLIVSGAYGLGRVTLIGFDPEDPPFRDWGGAGAFWLKVLAIPAMTDNSANFGWGRGGAIHRDIAARLHAKLEDFPEVTVVPFGWVAVLIFLYILLIGPVDYFFLKKVVKRLELTWIT